MSAEPTRCAKCNGAMVQGFIFEFDGAQRKVSSWVEGGAGKVLLAKHEGPEGKDRPDRNLPVLGLRLPGIVRP